MHKKFEDCADHATNFKRSSKCLESGIFYPGHEIAWSKWRKDWLVFQNNMVFYFTMVDFWEISGGPGSCILSLIWSLGGKREREREGETHTEHTHRIHRNLGFGVFFIYSALIISTDIKSKGLRPILCDLTCHLPDMLGTALMAGGACWKTYGSEVSGLVCSHSSIRPHPNGGSLWWYFSVWAPRRSRVSFEFQVEVSCPIARVFGVPAQLAQVDLPRLVTPPSTGVAQATRMPTWTILEGGEQILCFVLSFRLWDSGPVMARQSQRAPKYCWSLFHCLEE
jgi:hypothetical protein